MGFWSRSPPALTQEYQETVAHRVRDILSGEDHTSHKRRNKAAIKALQRPEALAGVIEILKTMPEPAHGSDHLQAEDEGVVLDTEAESNREPVKNQDKGKGKDMGQKQGETPGKALAVQGLFSGDGNKSSNSQTSSDNKTPKAKPNGATVVAAATIAAAAATSAAAAALALKRGRRKAKPIVHEKEETTVEVIDNTETTKSTKTVVHFRPSKDTVSSHA
jgi:hypothetical protein